MECPDSHIRQTGYADLSIGTKIRQHAGGGYSIPDSLIS